MLLVIGKERRNINHFHVQKSDALPQEHYMDTPPPNLFHTVGPVGKFDLEVDDD